MTARDCYTAVLSSRFLFHFTLSSSLEGCQARLQWRRVYSAVSRAWMPLVRCATCCDLCPASVSCPMQTTDDVKVKTRTGAFCKAFFFLELVVGFSSYYSDHPLCRYHTCIYHHGIFRLPSSKYRHFHRRGHKQRRKINSQS